LPLPLRTLGRIVNHDPRSRAYAVVVDARPLRSVTWKRFGPCLDQGAVGACTGFSFFAMLSCLPFWKPMGTRAPYSVADGIAMYSAATRADGIRGVYPPDDTGSSGLGVCKAAHKLGLIKSYRHAFGIQAALRALLDGPVITGTNWYEGFDAPRGPDAELVIAGAVRGGHEWMVRAVDLPGRRLFGDSSWGPSFGRLGGFSMSFDTWERLLREQGDVTAVSV
jgi:hypothetical protein